MLIFFFHVTLRYVTFKKSWIRHCALVKFWIRHRARYVTLRYVYKILDPPLSLVKSCIRHCARYFTLRYVTFTKPPAAADNNKCIPRRSPDGVYRRNDGRDDL